MSRYFFCTELLISTTLLMQKLNCQKHLFDLDEGVAYLNCAYMSPLLRTVKEKGVEMITLKSRPYQIGLNDFFNPVDEVKRLFAQLINCSDYRRVSIIPSASYGIANAVKNIPISKGQNVVMPAEQFPSNYYSWKQKCDKTRAQVRIVPCPDAPSRTSAWNEAILNAIDSQTVAVAISHTHWADGTVFDLKAIRKRCNEVGAFLVIDGTQSIGSFPYDQSQIKADALIVAGYKTLLGPYSSGVAYYGNKFDNGTPIEDNWINHEQSDDFANLVNYQERYQEKAARYSVGESSNFILTGMLLTAIAQILEWTPEAIQAYCQSITIEPLQAISEMGFGVESLPERASHLFGIRPSERFDFNRFNQICGEEKIHISRRGNTIRVAPHVYNTVEDLWRLKEALQSVST